MKIKIECEGAATVPVSHLLEFQGNLKSLSRENYLKLKKDILELGFSEPISVWKERDGDKFKLNILNGHQRLRAVKKMMDEDGVECESLPVSWVNADSMSEAKRKILSLASQFGRVDSQGLYEFIVENDITVSDLKDNFSFAEINQDRFEAEYFRDMDPLDVSMMGTPTETPSAGPVMSNVKMVNLYLTTETYQEWVEMISALSGVYNTENSTDTVMACLRETVNSLKNSN